MIDLNNNLLNTKSNKIRKVTTIKKFMLDQIDSNKNIKRFMRNLTKLPLSKKSEDYDGRIKTQNDPSMSLLIDSEEGEQCLYGGSFNPEMSNIKMPYIFVHSYRTNVNGSNSTIYFLIDVLCPEKYNRLLNYGDERIYEIADEIVQMFDGYTIEDEETSRTTGNLKLEVDGFFEEFRMSKSYDVIVLSIPIKVKDISLRSKK